MYSSTILLMMMMMTLASAVVDDATYCALRYRRLCQGKGQHVACLYPSSGPGEACENFTPIKINAEIKQYIVNYINRRRQRVAAGVERVRGGAFIPKPQVMMLVSWDRELAFLAYRLAEQCNFVHDNCRATVRYPYAGQTVGEVKWRRYKESDEHNALRAIKRIFDAWWGEKRRILPKDLTQPFTVGTRGSVFGHFTQLAVWNLQAVGCGAVRHGYGQPRILLVCDFSHTNMLGQRTITPGSLARCPKNFARRSRSPFSLLCAPAPKAKPREEYYSESEYDEDIESEDNEDITDEYIQEENTLEDGVQVSTFSFTNKARTKPGASSLSTSTTEENVSYVETTEAKQSTVLTNNETSIKDETNKEKSRNQWSTESIIVSEYLVTKKIEELKATYFTPFAVRNPTLLDIPLKTQEVSKPNLKQPTKKQFPPQRYNQHDPEKSDQRNRVISRLELVKLPPQRVPEPPFDKQQSFRWKDSEKTHRHSQENEQRIFKVDRLKEQLKIQHKINYDDEDRPRFKIDRPPNVELSNRDRIENSLREQAPLWKMTRLPAFVREREYGRNVDNIDINRHHQRQKWQIKTKERPGARALINVPTEEIIRSHSSKGTMRSLKMDEEDIEQLYHDTGFKPAWKRT